MDTSLSDRGFGFAFAGLFTVIALVRLAVAGTLSPLLLAIAAAFALIAWLSPWALMPLNRLWQPVARCIVRFNNTVLLAIAFYVVLTPLALVLRATARDALGRRFDPRARSYFTPVGRRGDASTLADLF